MAGTTGEESTRLDWLDELERKPFEFDFYWAVRRLESARAEQPRTGRAARASEDPVRFQQEPSLAFAPSTLSAFRRGDSGRPARLKVLFFGLLGPNGPLPLHLTEFARDRLRNSGDGTFAAFLDLFHHRMISLFYRAWAQAQPAVSFDRPETDRFRAYVGSTIGLGSPALWNRDALADRARLHYAGRLAAVGRGAEGLRSILADYFRVPVRVEEFQGEWLELPEESRLKLGGRSAGCRLGDSAMLGERVWTCHQKIRIRLGPLTLAAYRRFFSEEGTRERLRAWVRAYTGGELAHDVELTIKGNETPPLTLDGKHGLGHTTWLINRTSERDLIGAVIN